MQTFSQIPKTNRYRPIVTDDGSPSLVFTETSEPMHNRKGALSESLAIYLAAMERALEFGTPLRVLSVGLGLGYNEILFAALCEKQQGLDAQMTSFEKDPWLLDSFHTWAQKGESPLTANYQKILELTAAHLALDVPSLHQGLQHMIEKGSLELLGELTPETPFRRTYSCILFDPFSSLTNPELWGEGFLDHFLAKACAEQCILSTYAAKGNLKRSLLRHNFEVTLPEGYAGKRNRTWALRKNFPRKGC